jgi:hypothetical protein
MNRSITLAALAGVLFFSCAASAAEVRFRGAFTLTSVKNCLARYVGETFNSAFQPAGLGDNPAVTSLTQLNQYSGDVYELDGANFVPGQWTPVSAWGLSNLHYSFDAKIRLTQLEPKVITGKTKQLLMSGTIVNMGNDPGVGGKTCVAAFRGAYFRRIETN